ncbi:MAG: hypothetical protein PVG39_24165 [Desulfobacteraceae bacterium]|jgi:hypothetical protein
MICIDTKCPKVKDWGFCSVYSIDGQRFRNRQGYCPIPDAGPNKKVSKIVGTKKRAGQQKQKKA